MKNKQDGDKIESWLLKEQKALTNINNQLNSNPYVKGKLDTIELFIKKIKNGDFKIKYPYKG